MTEEEIKKEEILSEEAKEPVEVPVETPTDIECDPATQDCDSLKEQLKGLVRESDVVELGIKNFENAKKSLENAKNIFEDDSFDTQLEQINKNIDDARNIQTETEDKLYDGMKKFNLCDKTEEGTHA